MKKITAILFSALLVLSLAACGNSNQNTGSDTPAETAAPITEPADSSAENTTEPAEGETESTENSDKAEAENSNILIVYFSVMETASFVIRRVREVRYCLEVDSEEKVII